MRASDMSEHWRIVSVEGERVQGSFWVAAPTKPGKEAWVHTLDTLVWVEGRHWARSYRSGDLTASVVDGKAHLSKHMVRSDGLAEVEDVWDEMLEVIALAAATAFPAPVADPDDTKDGQR